MAEGIFTQEALEVYFIADGVGIPFLFVSGRLVGGLDVEEVGGMFEVQREREKAADWTLKWRGGIWKSKRSEKK